MQIQRTQGYSMRFSSNPVDVRALSSDVLSRILDDASKKGRNIVVDTIQATGQEVYKIFHHCRLVGFYTAKSADTISKPLIN